MDRGLGAASYFPGKFAGLPALRDEQDFAPFEDGAAIIPPNHQKKAAPEEAAS
jgi:hypothetical protein